MQYFLDQLVTRLMAKSREGLAKLCVVFPSRRATVFFERAWEKQAPDGFPEPAAFSIEEWVERLSGDIVIDQVAFALELYPIYLKYYPDASFDRFYGWSRLLFNDFEEVDRHLIEVGDLFREMHKLSVLDTEIASWHSEEEEYSDFQAQYLDLWLRIPDLYKALREKLSIEGKAWPGLAMRKILSLVESENVIWEYDQVVFAGFNAISPVEEKIITSLARQGKAEVVWDMDKWYVENPAHEAGLFFRKFSARFPEYASDWLGNSLSGTKKKLLEVAASGRVSQAKLAGLEIQKLLESGVREEEIAIVLLDEQLLFPLLNSLPEHIREINVTMGYPLRSAPLFGLVEVLLDAQRRAEAPGGSPGYYANDVIQLLNNPYIYFFDGELARKLIYALRQKELYRVPQSFWEELPEGHFFRYLFSFSFSEDDFFPFFLSLYTQIRTRLASPTNSGKSRSRTLELDYLFAFFTLTQKLQNKLFHYVFTPELSTLRRLYREVLENATLPFSGEPLKGIQVMGMLETRCLDFPVLLFLGANEGDLPLKYVESSFVPYSLRKAFGLPVRREREAVYSYHFYRLLQRANQVFLYYNASPTDFGKTEKSRYLLQLELELASGNPKVEYKSVIHTFSSDREEEQPVAPEKTPKVMKALSDFALEKGFSPSSLNVYLNCPLQFYYQFILRLTEPEEIEDSMSNATFGRIFHHAAQLLYEPYLGREVDQDAVEKMRERIPEVVGQAYAAEPAVAGIPNGRNMLLTGVIERLLAEVSRLDAQEGEAEIFGLELRLEQELSVSNVKQPVKVKGFLDRVDRGVGFFQVVDYKTGMRESLLAKQEEDFVRKKAAFQLFMYAWLLHKSENADHVVSGIYWLQDLERGFDPFLWGRDKMRELDHAALNDFEEMLLRILEELFDPKVNFAQTTDVSTCKYCSYKGSCGRY